MNKTTKIILGILVLIIIVMGILTKLNIISYPVFFGNTKISEISDETKSLGGQVKNKKNVQICDKSGDGLSQCAINFEEKIKIAK